MLCLGKYEKYHVTLSAINRDYDAGIEQPDFDAVCHPRAEWIDPAVWSGSILHPDGIPEWRAVLANWEKAVFVESAVHELLEVTDN